MTAHFKGSRRDRHVVPRLPGAVGCRTATHGRCTTLARLRGAGRFLPGNNMGELSQPGSRSRYGSETQVTFQAHNWPQWGRGLHPHSPHSTAITSSSPIKR